MKSIMRQDLTNVRCPDALLMLRKALGKLIDTPEVKQLHVVAIEPSLPRDAKYALNHLELSLSMDVMIAPISKDDRVKIDQDDPDLLIGVTEFQLLRFSKAKSV
ncbi:hypothetical protein [Vibrio harveyi]|uniref:hypothetical protein n=1 Tax=Vibrio harveyi TaxID=669 RepID=UPI00248031D8|nr:hypothetical protein [Vibrio harveyi]